MMKTMIMVMMMMMMMVIDDDDDDNDDDDHQWERLAGGGLTPGSFLGWAVFGKPVITATQVGST
jgi:hypothetical protein